MIRRLLEDKVGRIFATDYNEMWLYGITCFLSGIATIFTDKFSFEKGAFVKNEYQMNEFFFIPMTLFGKILIGLSILNIVAVIVEA